MRFERALKQKVGSTDNEASTSKSKVTRKNSDGASSKIKEECLFCGEKEDILHRVSTFVLDKRVRECALQLEDTVLLAKLSVGNLISEEVAYHNRCLVSLYN